LVQDVWLTKRTWVKIHLPHSLAEFVLYLSLAFILLFLILARPPSSFYTFLLAPIALAAVLYEFAGGTFVALVATAGVAVLIALDPNAARRAVTLQQVWPILSTYLTVGPVVGWLAARERERERRLVSAAERLHVVQEIAQAINTSLNLDKTLQTIIAETRRLIPFQRAVVMLREGDALRLVAASDSFRQLPEFVGRVFELQGSAAGWAVQHGRNWSGKPVDVSRYPDTSALCAPTEPCLIIPLKFQRRVIGAVLLGGQKLVGLSEADLDNLTQIAGQIAIAIEHARLYEAERQWTKHLTAISEASREIAASLDLERTLRLVMAKGVETLPMDAGALFLYDIESQAYRVAVSHNLSPDHVAQITFAFEEGVPGWVAKHRQPLIIPEASADRRVHPYVVEEGIQSVLAAPLMVREHVVGVFNLYCKTAPNAFDDEILRLTGVFAAQAAVAIENARLMEELRQAAADLEARVERRTRQLQETQAQIIRAEKLTVVGRLAASVAHEVNNPLQAIALQLQLIADDGLAEPTSKRLAIVQDELARIAGIVQRLLDFQRPTLGRRTQNDITVDRRDDPTLVSILVSGNQMKQVFLNLILNAIEAMPDGGHLQVCIQQSAGILSVSFADSGVGMTSEVMDHLFEPLYSTKINGTGLGLVVSHEIVSQHGGNLEASSQPGQGSTFVVRLPLHDKQGSEL
jgi:GAF domain-containing protein